MLDRKLGYYICNGQEFDSKIKACLYSVHVRKPVEWSFNNNVFKKHDWTSEPMQTLDELYDQRVRDLRNRYDYIMLSYSGGSDSHNILMSFIRQGIHLDEIVVNTMTKATAKFTDLDPNNKKNTNAAAEYELQTLPRLKEVSKLIPKTKITVVDMTDHLFDFLNGVGNGSWVLDKREQVNIAGATRFNYIRFDEIRKQFDKSKRISLVVGIEKPRSFIKDGIFYMAFQDRPANIITVAEHIRDYTNSSVEFFYWSPDALTLLTKQGHVIKRWLEAFPENQQTWKLENLTPAIYRTVHERLLRTLLYSTWDNNWYQADKAVKDWYSEFDQWFEDGYSNTKAFGVWREGIDFIEDKLKYFVKKDDVDGSKGDGLQSFFHSYPLGPMKQKSL